MPIITFIGAGSVVFTRDLLGDLCSFPELQSATVRLHDIDPERLATAEALARRTAEICGANPTIEAHPDRRAAIDGANYVINMVQVGMFEATRHDLEIPAKHGVTQTIGDTLGVGGIFRALRTFPVLEGIARDMHEVAADGAWLLNYTNPMAMNVWFTTAATPVKNVVGLCHSIQHTTRTMAEIVGVPFEEVTFEGAGVNHQAWILRFEHHGEDLYPRLDAHIEADPELRRRVRVELYRRFGYFPTESSEHSAEYLPWFLRRDDLVERYRLIPNEYIDRSIEGLAEYETTKQILASGADFEIERSLEYAIQIIHSIETGIPRVIYGNVRNDGLITNLPDGCCVEVPCVVDRTGVRPTFVGDLPVQCAALNRTFVNVGELTVRAAIDGDPRLVRHAAMLDPNTSSVLDIDQIWDLCNELTIAHGDALPEALRQTLSIGR
jgi:alpha-galactosidase